MVILINAHFLVFIENQVRLKVKTHAYDDKQYSMIYDITSRKTLEPFRFLFYVLFIIRVNVIM